MRGRPGAAAALCAAVALSCGMEANPGGVQASALGAHRRARCGSHAFAAGNAPAPVPAAGNASADHRIPRKRMQQHTHGQTAKEVGFPDGCGGLGDSLPPRLIDLAPTPQSVAALARSIQRGRKPRENGLARRPARCEHVDAETNVACRKRPCFGSRASLPALRCAQHRKGGDIDVVNPLCRFEQGCTKTATFGGADTCWKRAYCTAHRRSDHANVLLRTQLARRARAAAREETDMVPDGFGSQDVRKNREDDDSPARGGDMTEVEGMRDTAEGLQESVRQTGMPAGVARGPRKQAHAVCEWKSEDGNLSCWRRASFVSNGGADARADRCAFHRAECMPRATPLCTYTPEPSPRAAAGTSPGARDLRCRRRASYGERVAAAGGSVLEPLFCSLHRLPHHRSVHSIWCRAQGCLKAATYGCKGHTPRFCNRHKRAADVNLRHGCCRAPGCATSANYGPVTGNGLYCCRHKAPDHVNVARRRPLLTERLALVPARARAALERLGQVYFRRGRDAKATASLPPDSASHANVTQPHSEVHSNITQRPHWLADTYGGLQGDGAGCERAAHENISGRREFWRYIGRELGKRGLLPGEGGRKRPERVGVVSELPPN
jgi:hypothetical protein